MSDLLNITDQIKIAVSLAEGQFREFKSAYLGPPDQKQRRPVKEICRDVGEALVAFANADGGELLIGVEDDGTLTGTNDFDDNAIANIKLAPRNNVHKDTPLQSVLIRDAIISGKRMIYFRVAKGTKQIHLTSDGRCLKRNDLESSPVPAEQIQFDRREITSREYDREFVDGATVADLDPTLLDSVVDQISKGISADRCLQYLGLAEYEGGAGLRLRRAALLLFAKSPDQWHPRLQTRILKVNGTKVGVGADYNVVSDTTVKTNILRLIDQVWDKLRPHLVETKFQEDARFKSTYLYPEIACREAVVNAIAHRDYSDEGCGIEIFVFDDRMEITSPGSLLSSITLEEIKSLRGVHQSRNSYVARTLREIGLMRELGEGMRRIFEVMKHNELAPPEISSSPSAFSLTLHHRPMYSEHEVIWLDQFESIDLSAEEKAVLLLGRRGDLIAPNDIFRRLGIVDTEHYRQVVYSLQTKGVIESVTTRKQAQATARRKGVGARDIPRYKVVAPLRGAARSRTVSNKIPKRVEKSVSRNSNALYLGNVPPNTSERDIIRAFADYGTPAAVFVPKSGGYSKGYAFIEFDEFDAAKRALEADIFLGPRRLVIKWQTPRRR